MKKRSKWLAILLILALSMFSFAACGGDEEEPAEPEEPATESVLWSDEYAAMLESGEMRDYANYDALLEVMQEYQTEIGAYYVYLLDNGGDLDAAEYTITIDASEEPDDWGTGYEFEPQFKEAWEGEVAAARSAWDNDTDDPVWSAFAPVKDSDGNVVAIVGVDYPVQEILDFMEWNRDSATWNKAHEEFPADIPEEVQAVIDKVKGYAEEIAKKLSETNIDIPVSE